MSSFVDFLYCQWEMSGWFGTHVLGCNAVPFLRLYHIIPPTKALMTRMAMPNPTPAHATVVRPLAGAGVAGAPVVVLVTGEASADADVADDDDDDVDVDVAADVARLAKVEEVVIDVVEVVDVVVTELEPGLTTSSTAVMLK